MNNEISEIMRQFGTTFQEASLRFGASLKEVNRLLQEHQRGVERLKIQLLVIANSHRSMKVRIVDS